MLGINLLIKELRNNIKGVSAKISINLDHINYRISLNYLTLFMIINKNIVVIRNMIPQKHQY